MSFLTIPDYAIINNAIVTGILVCYSGLTIYPVDTGRKLNVHRRSEDVLDVFGTTVSTG